MVQKVEKRRKTGLTGLRKKQATPKKRQPEPPPDLVAARDAYDRVIDFLEHIRTLAGLLEAPGMGREAEEGLDTIMVSKAGGMILDEAKRLREALETIHRKTLEPHATHP